MLLKALNAQETHRDVGPFKRNKARDGEGRKRPRRGIKRELQETSGGNLRAGAWSKEGGETGTGEGRLEKVACLFSRFLQSVRQTDPHL